jgi:hypothetical protein
MVLGAVFFSMLAFGAGWTARGAAARFQAFHGRQGIAQGYGAPGMRGFGGSGQGQLPPGHPNTGRGSGRRGMMGDQGQGWSQDQGQCQGQGQGQGWGQQQDQQAPTSPQAPPLPPGFNQ